MTKETITRFIFINALIILLFVCDGIATLFHGAKPEEPPVTYTVTFDANGADGSAPPAQTVNTGTVISLPNKGDLASTGNIFAGWSENPGGGGTSYAVGASVTVTKNLVFYAQWLDSSTPQYTVTFNANGATSGAPPASQTVYSGISITIPNQGTLAYTGKTFDGWNTAANGSGTNYASGASFTLTTNTTLYAKWRSAIQYTVTYYANGATGAVPTAQTVDPGTSINLPGAGSLTWSGKTFTGWNTNAGGTGTSYDEGASYTVNANSSFYAQWSTAPAVPPGATLPEKLAYIAGRADDGTVYDIEISTDEYVEPQTVMTMGRNVTVYIHGPSEGSIPTISLYSSGSLFTVSTNITLKLENINIQGRSSNDTALIRVDADGTLVVEPDAKISGNTNVAGNGGGILIHGGAVIMNGGEISGNKSKTGGGVYLEESTANFTLKSGKIMENEATTSGGGMHINKGIVTMNGGEISGNTAANYGGGIYFSHSGSGKFIKISPPGSSQSGIIYGSSASIEFANTGPGAAICGWVPGTLYNSSERKYRNRTLGVFDEFSSDNGLAADWD
jgi:hypothetical protein